MDPDSTTYASPTYLLTSVRDFTESITYRMLADGMALPDIRAAAEVGDWAEWCAFWMDRALAHERLGDEALAKGATLTAGQHLGRASLCAHYGQFLYFEYPEIKRRAVELKCRLYRRAAPLVTPRAEPLEVPFDGVTLPAYLRVPAGSTPTAVVVLVGGVDAAKEDAHAFSSLCLDRGLATLAFDGPGQGETYYRGRMLGPDFHRAISAVIDALVARPEIDGERVGILGRSLGGFFAPQAAALDGRLRACVAWGGLYDLGSYDRKPPLIKDGYRFLTGARDWDDTRRATAFISLRGVAERIACPFLVVHGARDNSVPVADAERMVGEAKGPSTLWVVPDSIHCSHDVAHVVRPAMADWLVRQLAVPDPPPGT